MKYLLFLIFTIYITTILSSTFVYSQEDKEFEKWKKKEQEAVQKYKDERDKEFVDFLKQQWREMKLMEGLVADDKPKPDKLPVYTPSSDKFQPSQHGSYKIIENVNLTEPIHEKELVLDISNIELNPASSNKLDFKFILDTLKIKYDPNLKVALNKPINEDAISKFWNVISQANYEDIIKQAYHYKDNLNLNDWGYCLLLKKIGDVIYENSENEVILFVWFILSKSGYKVKVGYENDLVHILISSRNKLYGIPYFKLGEEQEIFYAVSLDNKENDLVRSIYTYEGDYPGSNKDIVLTLDKLPNMRSRIKAKDLKFKYSDTLHMVRVNVDMNIIEFLKYYPQTELGVYFNSSVSKDLRRSLISSLKPYIEGKTEYEAVNILLRFVQTAFTYKTDIEQFGREKPMFPEETIYYNFSDCEDRSILFSYLIKNLLGLEIIGLDYPSHVATAVKFTNDIPGDKIRYQNEIYTICDPTYENANAGICMPQFRNIVPFIVKLNTNN